MLDKEWRQLLSLIPGYDSEATAEEGDYFDAEAAQFALDFFAEVLTFIEGPKGGQPFKLEPWQQAIVACLWGWKKADGSRRFREALLYVPRKNGKSPLVAGLALLSLLTDHEPGAQVFCAASSKDQAKIVFRHAAGMVAREPELADRLRVYRTASSIEYREENSYFRALASDSGPLHGLGANFVIIDELHSFKDSELVDTLTTSTAARTSPLILYTTTADYQRPSICNTTYERACAVRDGKIRDSAFLPIIYEAPEGSDWTDERTWKLANPNLGVSVSLDYLKREVEKAKTLPSHSHVVKRLHLNVRTGTAVKWIDPETWNACRADMPDLSGLPAFAGMDLSQTLDISAVILAIPESDDPDAPVWLVPRFYLPEAKLDEKQDRVPYRQWHRDGYLIATPGNVIDYEFIRADLNRLAKVYDLQDVRYDPWNASQIAIQLSDTDGLPVTAMRQGYASMAFPTAQFERMAVAGQLRHDGNPVLSWMLGGCMIERDAHDNMKVTKQKSTTRVDGVVASVMALASVLGREPEYNPQVVWLNVG